ncbi:MAG: response regulator [Cyclobacteriaceae bacterium]
MRQLIAYLCLLFGLLGATHLWAQTAKISFHHISTESGLSHNQVNSFYEDQYGFVWIGTLSGLNRYDGYTFEKFYHQDNQPNSLASNTIFWINEGPNQQIWFNTANGLSIYDPGLEQFIATSSWLERLQIQGNQLNKIIVDRLHQTWFIDENHGLIMTDQTNTYRINSSDTALIKIGSNLISDVSEDDQGNLWVLHRAGLIEVIDPFIKMIRRKFDLSKVKPDMSFSTLFIDSDQDIWAVADEEPYGLYYLNTSNGKTRYFDATTIKSSIVRQVLEDGDRQIWVGTDHGGITLIDKSTWNITSVSYEPNNPRSLNHNSITTIYRSKSGLIWVGKNKNGISLYNERVGSFDHFKYDSDDPAFNDISSIVEDADGNLLLGTNGRGVLKFDIIDQHIRPAGIDLSDESKLGSNVVVDMCYTQDNMLWIGTYLEGLYRFRDQKIQNFTTNPNENSVSDNNIWRIYEDSQHNIWLGTLQRGLDKYNTQTHQFTNYHQPEHLSVNYVTDIVEDHNGHIWIATGVGLTRHDPSQQSFKHYLASDNLSSSLSNNSVIALLVDADNQLWVGTLDGLNLYQPATDDFKVFRDSDGLASSLIMSMVDDDQGNLWISTSKGISRVKVENAQLSLLTFDQSDGLQSETFIQNATIRTRNGKLVFGGQNGFNYFDPNEIQSTDIPPKLVLSSFSVNNQRIEPNTPINNNIILHKSITETDRVTLNHDQNSFTFEFAALTFDQADKNKYEYQLEGFNENWIPTPVRRANYTNLDYGEYTFRVRAANKYNTWNNEDVSVQILIHPPWWRSKWAYATYIFFIIGGLFLIRELIIIREREKAKIENDKLDAKRRHELDLLKIKFFTNVSHEFRTPLSLIISPIEYLIETDSPGKKTDFLIIQRNAKRLLRLVNQLLDFRKMEVQQHKLSASVGDLIKFIKDVMESFMDLSKETNVELSFESELTQFYTSFDKDKMDKILFNLISNAFKFTPADGKIAIDLEKSPNTGVTISVTDTGIGISQKEQDRIFERFIQADNMDHMINNGTGIGLSITKEFIELHGGKIELESEPNQGTNFSIHFPFEQIDNTQDTNPILDQASNFLPDLIDSNKQTIMLVEDNSDFRFYLKDNLKTYYNVLEAQNGKQAWKQICDHHPDIIISDIMMPIMNGLDLCRKVKSDPRTADIPLVLLTAQQSDEHRLEGLEAGALDFITKPFNFRILVSSINSALKFHDQILDTERKKSIAPKEVQVISQDEVFLQKAIDLIEQHMSNSEFSVERLGHELGYSRGHLYQKMLQITGQTPIDFIRNMRMKRAKELLEKSQMNVAQVAYEVGYNNPKLFSRYFKSFYKVYPSELINKAG